MAHPSSNGSDLPVSNPFLNPTSKSKFRLPVDLKMYLSEDAKTGAPLATLSAQSALVTASFCLWETRLCSEYDHSGIKTAILYHICAVLLCYANRLSGRRFLRRQCGVKVNSIANLICLILGILFERFYEKSLASLCFALIMTILFLILVVIIHPRTDVGFSGFLIGATGSVAYNLFQLKLGTWIVVAICFVLLCFKCWLDKIWLEVEVAEPEQEHKDHITWRRDIRKRMKMSENLLPAPIIQSIGALTIAGFYLVWASAFLSTNCLNSKCCASCSAMERFKCGAIFGLWVSPALIHRVYSLFQVEFWVLLPTSMPYVKQILRLEHILNNLRRLEEERPLMRSRNQFGMAKTKLTLLARKRIRWSRGLDRTNVLREWVWNIVKNKFDKIEKEIETHRDLKFERRYSVTTFPW